VGECGLDTGRQREKKETHPMDCCFSGLKGLRGYQINSGDACQKVTLAQKELVKEKILFTNSSTDLW